MKPFLKWAGGKRQLLPDLAYHLPKSFNRYFEPFVGGGALFFYLREKGIGLATIGDANARLMRTYEGVRDNVEGVIRTLQQMPYNEKFYYKTRAQDCDAFDPFGMAAWFIYINRAGFNGLYRVNKAGKVNVPFGRYTNPTICDVEGLTEASKALRGVKLLTGDFEKIVAGAKRGDLVYFDPPYVPVSQTADFT